MMEASTRARMIVLHASGEALPSPTAQMLSRLGYQIWQPEDFERERAERAELRPDLLLVDERRLSEATAHEEDPGSGASTPIVLLSGRHGATGADPRIVGAVKRPAGLHDLYRLMQQIFEDTPRTTPRIATHLLAHCHARGEEWDGRVLSLSENGCLMRSAEPILLGDAIQLEIALPRRAPIALEAEAAYQLLPDVGLVFNAVAPNHRETLGAFVTQTILTA